MAFSFSRYKTPAVKLDTGHSINDSPRKLTAQQTISAAKTYPSWLKDNASNLKQLPGIYQGVLGQVQLQIDPMHDSSQQHKSNKHGPIQLVSKCKRSNPVEYFNSFTDTERVKQLLSMSNLSNETLATIWAHVNKTYPGRLTNREVCLSLGLIALFQRLEKDGKNYNQVAGHKEDPFNLIKSEQKPPIPKLYPCNDSSLSANKNNSIASSNSVPTDLNKADSLLIDINDEADTSKGEQAAKIKSVISSFELSSSVVKPNYLNISNLIDSDNDKLDPLLKQCHVWLRVMNATRAIFKRAFDVLNVENSRQSALEALNSAAGAQFCKNLCLCYPIAHNIKFKVDELDKKNLLLDNTRVDKNYSRTISDLMISINEYWAVLINLFHESGQTSFIELILDGLNKTNKTVTSNNHDELLIELDCNDGCAICQTKFYLVNIGDALERRELSEEEINLALNHELITNDGHYYYHARCANFWLNNVDNRSRQLPFFQQELDDSILKPTSS